MISGLIPNYHSEMEKLRQWGPSGFILAFKLNYGAVFSRKCNFKRSFLTISRPDRELTDTEMEIIGEKFDVWVDMIVGNTELTDGELDVLRGLKDGLGRSAIADQLGISESAVKQRAQKACVKLGAKTRTQAVAVCVPRTSIRRHQLGSSAVVAVVFRHALI